MRVAFFIAVAAMSAWDVRGEDQRPIQASKATADQDAGRDRGSVYRFDLAGETLEVVPENALRPGHIYSRFDVTAGRWVWSKADAQGGLQYAMGEGSVQPARLFDLRGSDAERLRILEQRAPDLARLFTIQGARPMLRLDATGQWRLGRTPCVSSVYDMNTRERWEWHADQPSRVVHAGGTRWDVAAGRYVPGR
jgi:hypothetical protein